jgi:hypothetical protein
VSPKPLVTSEKLLTGQPRWTRLRVTGFYVPQDDRPSFRSELIKQQEREDESNDRLNAEAVDRWADEGGASSNKRTSDVTLIQIGVHPP